MICLCKLKSNLVREAHSVDLELGVGDYEIEPHTKKR